MQISGRFAVAVHILTCADYFHGTCAVTSDFLASSVGVNPVIIRQIISRLKAAGLVEVSRGKIGINLARPLTDITLYDVYEAVESVKDKLFRLHPNPNPACPVGKNIHRALGGVLDEIQEALEDRLRSARLSDIASSITDASPDTRQHSTSPTLP